MTIRLLIDTLNSVGYEKNWHFAWWAYSVADLSKYLPGGFWGIAGRIYLYLDNGIPLAIASRAFLIESIIIALFSVCLGVSMITAGGSFLAGLYLLFTIVSLAITSYVILHLLMHRLPTSKKLLCWLGQITAWLCFGLSFALLSTTFYPEQNMLSMGGIFDVAFAAGFFAFFAPSGIGVREAVMGYWAHFASQDISMILKLTIIHRGIWAISDAMMFFAVWIYRFGFTKMVP